MHTYRERRSEKKKTGGRGHLGEIILRVIDTCGTSSGRNGINIYLPYTDAYLCATTARMVVAVGSISAVRVTS